MLCIIPYFYLWHYNEANYLNVSDNCLYRHWHLVLYQRYCARVDNIGYLEYRAERENGYKFFYCHQLSVKIMVLSLSILKSVAAT